MLLASESVNRNSQKTMLPPGVASHYGSVAGGSCLVGAKDLPLQGIREVDQFGLVEL